VRRDRTSGWANREHRRSHTSAVPAPWCQCMQFAQRSSSAGGALALVEDVDHALSRNAMVATWTRNNITEDHLAVGERPETATMYAVTTTARASVAHLAHRAYATDSARIQRSRAIVAAGASQPARKPPLQRLRGRSLDRLRRVPAISPARRRGSPPAFGCAPRAAEEVGEVRAHRPFGNAQRWRISIVAWPWLSSSVARLGARQRGNAPSAWHSDRCRLAGQHRVDRLDDAFGSPRLVMRAARAGTARVTRPAPRCRYAPQIRICGSCV
jgi:hypothetical protein